MGGGIFFKLHAAMLALTLARVITSLGPGTRHNASLKHAANRIAGGTFFQNTSSMLVLISTRAGTSFGLAPDTMCTGCPLLTALRGGPFPLSVDTDAGADVCSHRLFCLL